MADYVSALNGQQMDAALTEVALYNPEAWAVGTRNGVNVTSADETYHNNAKYYAQVAQSAIPGTYTAAVRWDIAQGLAGEAQEQARANISAGASNRNLLDNPWFTVNQRNVSGTITSGYIADRWTITYGSGGVQASRTADSITVKSTSGSSHGDIAQRMEKSLFDFLVGKTVTASVMRSNGSVISKSFTFQSAVSSINVGTDLDGNAISVRVYQASTYQDVQFWKWNTAGTFRAVKLELGSYSTLANDVPPDYGEELRKCRRYFRRYAPNQTGLALIGRAGSTTEADFILGDEPMAKSTGITAAINDAVYARAGDNTNHSVTSAVVQTSIGGGPALICATTGLTLGATAVIVFASGGYIDINGDL